MVAIPSQGSTLAREEEERLFAIEEIRYVNEEPVGCARCLRCRPWCRKSGKASRFALAEQVVDAATAQAWMLGMRPDFGTIVPAAFAFFMR